jgi:phosphoribosyl-AMP cyclohydrolase|tara:strand:+ start:447 stop:818 length:372 start_codon:yes stop_codon:yes gene_type:complete
VSNSFEISFSDNGLVPVIAQNIETNEVLMLAYADITALSLTRKTGLAHYFSRSRNEIWKKGETSGNIQHVHEIRVDCDGDAILYIVSQTNNACHTGKMSCFHNQIIDVISDGSPTSKFFLESI